MQASSCASTYSPDSSSSAGVLKNLQKILANSESKYNTLNDVYEEALNDMNDGMVEYYDVHKAILTRQMSMFLQVSEDARLDGEVCEDARALRASCMKARDSETRLNLATWKLDDIKALIRTSKRVAKSIRVFISANAGDDAVEKSPEIAYLHKANTAQEALTDAHRKALKKQVKFRKAAELVFSDDNFGLCDEKQDILKHIDDREAVAAHLRFVNTLKVQEIASDIARGEPRKVYEKAFIAFKTHNDLTRIFKSSAEEGAAARIKRQRVAN